MKPTMRSLCLVAIILLGGCLSKSEVGAHPLWSAKNADFALLMSFSFPESIETAAYWPPTAWVSSIKGR
ncbi:hypothetical protein DA391_03555 [Yersinia massiliensis]|uniref:Lipoprotein n=1 Tax=Yersinia massiliensis TaxID=419257 RepID=A0ABM6UPZ4_9GAMM|nr:hypothetical protein DA391_03555 [Yersinia massiliensis]